MTTITSKPYPRSRRPWALALALGLGLIALFVLCLSLGSVAISPLRIWGLLTGSDMGDPGLRDILMLFRLPKALTAMASGSALAVSGLLMQSLFSNQLASPDILGTNAGASIGVAVVLLWLPSADGSTLAHFLRVQDYLVLIMASAVGSAAVLFAVLAVSFLAKNPTHVLIAGIMFGFIANSAVSFLMFTALPQRAPNYLTWTYGSFQGVQLGQALPMLGLSLASGAIAWSMSRSLDALSFGPNYARSLGINIRGLRMSLIAISAGLSGLVTALCGPIAFLGLAAPYAAKWSLRRQAHALLIPFSALWGACIALGAESLSVVLGKNSMLPLNPLLSLLGAPIVLSLILKPRRRPGFGGSN